MLFLITCAARLMVNFWAIKLRKFYSLPYYYKHSYFATFHITPFEKRGNVWFMVLFVCFCTALSFNFILSMPFFVRSHFFCTPSHVFLFISFRHLSSIFYPLPLHQFLRFENTFFFYQSLPKSHQF